MDNDAKIREAMDVERAEIAFVIWRNANAINAARGRKLFDALNQPPEEHPALASAFRAADELLRSVATLKALFDARLYARLEGDKSSTAARLGICDTNDCDLIMALRQWGGEMDRSASELLSHGQIHAGGGSATVAALMKESAARLEKAAAGG